MLIFISIVLSFPAFAADVHWVRRPSAHTNAIVETLRRCGVEGSVLNWREGQVALPHLLVTRLPARVSGACRAPWVFLHDAEMLAHLRRYMTLHEGLLLNLRGVGSSRLVRESREPGFARLRELEPALDDAVLSLRPESDVYGLLGALRRHEDVLRRIERTELSDLPAAVLKPTVRFVREARVAAAQAHALSSAQRPVELQVASDDEKVVPTESRVYRLMRLLEVQQVLIRNGLKDFEFAYAAAHLTFSEAMRRRYDDYLARVVPPEDFRVLGLSRLFPKCVEALNPPKSADEI